MVLIFQAPLRSDQQEDFTTTGSCIMMTGGGSSTFQTAAHQFKPSHLFNKIIADVASDEVKQSFNI